MPAPTPSPSGPRDQVQDLVRDRGARRHEDGRTGRDPREAAEAIWARGKDAAWDSDRIDEIERTTKHDVIAFLTHVSETVGEEARFLHQGMTSSDVLDTCFAVQLARASDLLIEGVDRVLAALETRAREHKYTPASAAATASMPSR
jgi:adenylosuccinate lyase